MFIFVEFNNVDAASRNDSSRSYQQSLIFDSKGIPSFNYGYRNGTFIGIQRNPITISFEASKFYDTYLATLNSTARQFFLNNAEWLTHNGVEKTVPGRNLTYVTYEYSFPYPPYDLEPPWRSAMAQGLALGVLSKAYLLTGEIDYLDPARKLINSLYVQVKDGGVTYKTNNSGWWYEEYASIRTSSREKKIKLFPCLCDRLPWISIVLTYAA